MEKFYNKLFKNASTVALTVVISVLVIVGLVTAATTIGTNFSTDGTLTVTGLSTLGAATSTSATTTDYLYVGADGTENFFDFQGGDLYVQDDAEIDSDLIVAGKATVTVAVTIGAPTANYIDFTGGDLIVQDDIEVDSDVRIGGNASTTGDIWVSGSTFDLTTTTATTTPGLFIRDNTTATSTLSIGDDVGDTVVGCIEMIRSDGTYARAIIDGTDWNIQAGRCND